MNQYPCSIRFANEELVFISHTAVLEGKHRLDAKFRASSKVASARPEHLKWAPCLRSLRFSASHDIEHRMLLTWFGSSVAHTMSQASRRSKPAHGPALASSLPAPMLMSPGGYSVAGIAIRGIGARAEAQVQPLLQRREIFHVRSQTYKP